MDLFLLYQNCIEPWLQNRDTYWTVNFVYRHTPRSEVRSPLISGTFPRQRARDWVARVRGAKSGVDFFGMLSLLKSVSSEVIGPTCAHNKLIYKQRPRLTGRCGHNGKQRQFRLVKHNSGKLELQLKETWNSCFQASLIGHCKAMVSWLLIRLTAANSSMSGPTGGFSGTTYPSLDLLQNGPSLYYTSEDLITTQWLSFAFFSFLFKQQVGQRSDKSLGLLSAHDLFLLCFMSETAAYVFFKSCRRLLTFRSISLPVRNVSWHRWHFVFVLPLFIFCMKRLRCFLFSGSIGIFILI